MARLDVKILNLQEGESFSMRETDDLNQLLFRVESATFDFHNLYIHFRDSINAALQRKLIKEDQEFLKAHELSLESGAVVFHDENGNNSNRILKIPFWNFYDQIQKQRLERIIFHVNQKYFGPPTGEKEVVMPEEQLKKFELFFAEPTRVAGYSIYLQPILFRLSMYEMHLRSTALHKFLVEIPLFKAPDTPDAVEFVHKVLKKNNILPFSFYEQFDGLWLHYTWDVPQEEKLLEQQVQWLHQLLGIAQMVYDFVHSREFNDWLAIEFLPNSAVMDPKLQLYTKEELERLSLIHPSHSGQNYDDQWAFWHEQRGRFRLEYYFKRNEIPVALNLIQSFPSLTSELVKELVNREDIVTVEEVYRLAEKIDVKFLIIQQLIHFAARKKIMEDILRYFKIFFHDMKMKKNRYYAPPLTSVLSYISKYFNPKEIVEFYRKIDALKRDRMPMVMQAEWLTFFLQNNYVEKFTPFLQEAITAVFLSLPDQPQQALIDRVVLLWEAMQPTNWTELKRNSVEQLQKVIKGMDYEGYYRKKISSQ